MIFWKQFLLNLGDRRYKKGALKVALVVGSVLFAINHGGALTEGKMTKQRWFSGVLTYLVPYCVNIHGQTLAQQQRRQEQMMESLVSQDSLYSLK